MDARRIVTQLYIKFISLVSRVTENYFSSRQNRHTSKIVYITNFLLNNLKCQRRNKIRSEHGKESIQVL